ncbi:MAG: hypothetical protein FWC39_10615 [Bacteroidetes bacterium]|nr:hypothetical protein [Bacteroidota bacterium]
MKNCLAVNEIGEVDGKTVQCLEINEEDAEKWEQETDGDVCKFYDCAFKNMIPCLAKCFHDERHDEKNVYYKLITNN